MRKLMIKDRQRVFTIGIQIGNMTHEEMLLSLGELGRLVDTARGVVVGSEYQSVRRPNPATFIGKGKVDEIKELVDAINVDIVVVDDELTPVQNRNLEDAWGVLVLDRSAIILDIFAMRARSKEGKLQVELAQLEYFAPRLVGRGKMLSQQVGGIGTRGPGETQLEYDRRRIKDRMSLLQSKLYEVEAQRRIHRLKRESVPVPLVSIIGYTNAGKSTLVNKLTNAGLFVEDKLFATLDPTVRRLKLPSGREVLFADTVGFIRRLPHQLVDAFKATFEEVAHAHLLVHLIDGSHADVKKQIDVVRGVLTELGLADKPFVEVMNKFDSPNFAFSEAKGKLTISALTGYGIDALLARIDEILHREFKRVIFHLPHNRGDILSTLYRLGYVWKVEYVADGIMVDCDLHDKFIGKYERYIVKT